MIYCLNPRCPKPENIDGGKFCIACGQQLQLGDRYVGLKLLQQGIKGRTLLGIDRANLDHPTYCIIKQAKITESVLPERFVREFEHHVQKLKSLGDRREFPTVLDYFIPQNLEQLELPPTIIFEKIDGESLRQRLVRQGHFSEVQIRELLSEILPLVEIIHQHEVIHRDLNPDNLIFTPEHFWAIVDFSAAKVTSKAAKIVPGTLIGSGVYTAPEQLRGKALPASDLYSLGVICLEALTLFHPFDLYSSQEGRWVWRDYVTAPISDELGHVLDTLAAESWGDRFSSAEAVIAALDISPRQQQEPEQSILTPKLLVQSRPQWHCVHTFQGHGGYISDLNFHASGEMLASASADQTIKLWDINHKRQVNDLRGHRSIVSAVVFADEWLISAGWDYAIRVWDWHHGMEIKRLEAHPSWIYDLALFENDQYIAAASADGKITLWDVAQATVQQSWVAEGVTQIMNHPQENWLVSAGLDNIVVWQDGEKLMQLTGHHGQINACTISRNGVMLVSAGEDKTLRYWSLPKHRQQQVIHTANSIQAIALHPEKSLMFTGDDAGHLSVWQLGQKHPSVTLKAHDHKIGAIALSPDGSIVATGSHDKTIKLWQFGLPKESLSSSRVQ